MNTPITRAEHEEFRRRMEEEHERFHQRLKKVENTQDQITELTISVRELALSVRMNTESQNDHEQRLEELEDRDGEMWRDVTKYAVTAVIGGVITFMFCQLGM